MPEPQTQKSEAVKIALIGAAATLGAAIIAGVFGLIHSGPAQPATVTQQSSASATTAPVATQSSIAEVSTNAQQPLAAPMLFASRIAPDGEALNPSDTFESNIKD